LTLLIFFKYQNGPNIVRLIGLTYVSASNYCKHLLQQVKKAKPLRQCQRERGKQSECEDLILIALDIQTTSQQKRFT